MQNILPQCEGPKRTVFVIESRPRGSFFNSQHPRMLVFRRLTKENLQLFLASHNSEHSLGERIFLATETTFFESRSFVRSKQPKQERHTRLIEKD